LIKEENLFLTTYKNLTLKLVLQAVDLKHFLFAFANLLMLSQEYEEHLSVFVDYLLLMLVHLEQGVEVLLNPFII
jgi:hypothetical protein